MAIKKVKGMPITAAKPETSMRQPFVPNSKDTSADAQTMIDEPPAPFKNKRTAAQQPTPSAASGGISTLEPSIRSGMKRTTPGARALPSGAPVGQRNQPNQGGQIGGRQGFPPPKRKAGQIPGYFGKARRNASFYGE